MPERVRRDCRCPARAWITGAVVAGDGRDDETAVYHEFTPEPFCADFCQHTTLCALYDVGGGKAAVIDQEGAECVRERYDAV